MYVNSTPEELRGHKVVAVITDKIDLLLQFSLQYKCIRRVKQRKGDFIGGREARSTKSIIIGVK